MTLAQIYWLSIKLKLARWHDRRYREIVEEVETAFRNAGWRV